MMLFIDLCLNRGSSEMDVYRPKLRMNLRPIPDCLRRLMTYDSKSENFIFIEMNITMVVGDNGASWIAGQVFPFFSRKVPFKILDNVPRSCGPCNISFIYLFGA